MGGSDPEHDPNREHAEGDDRCDKPPTPRSLHHGPSDLQRGRSGLSSLAGTMLGCLPLTLRALPRACSSSTPPIDARAPALVRGGAPCPTCNRLLAAALVLSLDDPDRLSEWGYDINVPGVRDSEHVDAPAKRLQSTRPAGDSERRRARSVKLVPPKTRGDQLDDPQGHYRQAVSGKRRRSSRGDLLRPSQADIRAGESHLTAKFLRLPPSSVVLPTVLNFAY